MSELDDIKANYDAGRLEGLRGDLERFLVSHRERILRFSAEQAARGLTLPFDSAVKFYILRGSETLYGHLSVARNPQ